MRDCGEGLMGNGVLFFYLEEWIFCACGADILLRFLEDFMVLDVLVVVFVVFRWLGSHIVRCALSPISALYIELPD